MDKMTQPQQLNLSFEAPPLQQSIPQVEFTPTMASPSDPTISSAATVDSAVVFDFRSEVSKREESSRASLYRRILDSVSHIG